MSTTHTEVARTSKGMLRHLEGISKLTIAFR